jgi:2-C-methyl-D-erythritol 4-phosphate cytidylyltransferase
MKFKVIIPAGGKGERAGSSLPKQYIKIQGKEIISRTIEVFQKNKIIDEIIVAADPQYFPLLQKIKEKYRFNKISKFVKGGNERQDSVFNALSALKADDDDFIIVHDAARPLLSKNILISAIAAAEDYGSAVVCIRAKDTLIKGDDFIKSFLNRNEVLYVQTPQIFLYKYLLGGMLMAQVERKYFSDESGLIKNYFKKKIKIVEGSVFNFKVTTKEDVKFLKQLLTNN